MKRMKSHLSKKEKTRLADLMEKKGVPSETLPLSFLGGPFVVSDPSQDDTPIVFASKSFLALTGYKRDEVEGRNCRFLQEGGNGMPHSVIATLN